jgi:hypothetical protein
VKIGKHFFLVISTIICSCIDNTNNVDRVQNKIEINSAHKIIGEEGIHYAFTDIVFFEKQFF